MKKASFAASSSLIVAAALCAPCHASEQDAADVFSAALVSSFTFNGQRIAEDVGLGFLHFTKSGRAALISELERSGVVSQALVKRGSLKAFAVPSKSVVVKRVGKNGLDEFDVRAQIDLQWNVCDVSPCVPAGPRKKAQFSGVVVPVLAFGRPTYKVSSVVYEDQLK